MDYKELVESLKSMLPPKVLYGDLIGAEGVYAHSGPLVYEDPEPYFIEQAANAITDLLARAEAAEARCATLEKMVKEYQEVIIPGYREQAENAERERDAAVSDLTFAVNQYRLFTTDIDLCGLCKFDLPPAGENGQTHECPGFYKDNCFEWRGKKEE